MNKWVTREMNVTVELENRNGRTGHNAVEIEFEAHIYGAHDDLQCDDIKISYLTECDAMEKQYIEEVVDSYVDDMIRNGDIE